MKKGTIVLITLLLMVIGYSAYNTTINIYGNSKIAENISDFKVYISSLKVNGNEVSGINGSKDGFSLSNIDGNIEVEITNDSTEYDTEASLECETNNTWDFDYTKSEQTLTIPITGTYKLETWGAQGGKGVGVFGGYGGYSVGNIKVEKDDKLYINVGSTDLKQCDETNSGFCKGGYNGGGDSHYLASEKWGAGGGATHIATKSGLLSSLANYKSEILIVSGGGGGGYNRTGASAGGFIGNNGDNRTGFTTAIGGSQTTGGNGYVKGSFGAGGTCLEANCTGGGGGFFGGGGAWGISGAGGSSYIANPLLTEKVMYCYNCSESSETLTKTISTTCKSSTPTANCSKQGNGYARITLVDSTNNFITEKVMIEAISNSNKKLENIKNKSLTCKLKLNKISRIEKKNPNYYIYDNGTKNTNLTDVSCGAFENKGSCVVGNSSITIKNNATEYSNAYITTTSMIDFSKYNAIYINLKTKGTNKYHYVAIRKTPISSNNSYYDGNDLLRESVPIGYDGIIKIDVSSINDYGYLSLWVRQSTGDTTSSEATISRIWLEANEYANKENPKYYIYNNGTKNTNLTDISCISFKNKGSCTIGNNSITIKNSAEAYSNAYLTTMSMIDFGKYNAIYINLKTKGTNKYHHVTIRKENIVTNDSINDGTNLLTKDVPIGYDGIIKIDVSSINDYAYLSFWVRQSTGDTTSSEATISQIWLE